MKHQDLDRRSLELHRLVATKVRRDPALLGRAAEILARWRQTPSLSAPYLDEWQRLIGAGMDACLAVVTEASERANTLRSCSPLSCLLTEEERLDFLADWYGYAGVERNRWKTCIREAQAIAARITSSPVNNGEFERRWNALYKSVSDRYDIANRDLSALLGACIKYGWIPADMRERHVERVPPGAFDYIEATAAALFG